MILRKTYSKKSLKKNFAERNQVGNSGNMNPFLKGFVQSSRTHPHEGLKKPAVKTGYFNTFVTYNRMVKYAIAIKN